MRGWRGRRRPGASRPRRARRRGRRTAPTRCARPPAPRPIGRSRRLDGAGVPDGLHERSGPPRSGTEPSAGSRIANRPSSAAMRTSQARASWKRHRPHAPGPRRMLTNGARRHTVKPAWNEAIVASSSAGSSPASSTSPGSPGRPAGPRPPVSPAENEGPSALSTTTTTAWRPRPRRLRARATSTVSARCGAAARRERRPDGCRRSPGAIRRHEPARPGARAEVPLADRRPAAAGRDGPAARVGYWRLGLARVAPPRLRRLTSFSVRIRCTKP